MLVITKPNKVPHGGYWKYRDADSGAEFAHPVLSVLQDKVYKHRTANGKTFDPTEFIQNVCATTGPNICHDANNHEYNIRQQVVGVTKAAFDWAKSGFKMAEADILAVRIEKCNACEHWGGSRGGSLMSGRCKVCGCRGIKLSLATSTCPIGKW